MDFLPATGVADFTGTFLDVLSDNLVVILGIFGFMVAVKWIFKRLNKSAKGNI